MTYQGKAPRTGAEVPRTPIDALQAPLHRVPVVCGMNTENVEVLDV